MQLTLPKDIQNEIEQRVKSGKYRSAEDFVAVAVSTLIHQEALEEFDAGELDALIDEGEEDINHGRVIDGELLFAELRRMSAERRGAK